MVASGLYVTRFLYEPKNREGQEYEKLEKMNFYIQSATDNTEGIDATCALNQLLMNSTIQH